MNNIQDLLRLYADISIVLDNCEKSHADEPLSSGLMSEIESIRRRKIEIESQIVELFKQAEERGAKLERAECAKIAEDAWVMISGFGSPDFNAHYKACQRIAEAIDGRNTESGEGE
jgi:hypothetical protein